jgi:hypothetical protein
MSSRYLGLPIFLYPLGCKCLNYAWIRPPARPPPKCLLRSCIPVQIIILNCVMFRRVGEFTFGAIITEVVKTGRITWRYSHVSKDLLNEEYLRATQSVGIKDTTLLMQALRHFLESGALSTLGGSWTNQQEIASCEWQQYIGGVESGSSSKKLAFWIQIFYLW